METQVETHSTIERSEQKDEVHIALQAKMNRMRHFNEGYWVINGLFNAFNAISSEAKIKSIDQLHNVLNDIDKAFETFAVEVNKVRADEMAYFMKCRSEAEQYEHYFKFFTVNESGTFEIDESKIEELQAELSKTENQ